MAGLSESHALGEPLLDGLVLDALANDRVFTRDVVTKNKENLITCSLSQMISNSLKKKVYNVAEMC